MDNLGRASHFLNNACSATLANTIPIGIGVGHANRTPTRQRQMLKLMTPQQLRQLVQKSNVHLDSTTHHQQLRVLSVLATHDVDVRILVPTATPTIALQNIQKLQNASIIICFPYPTRILAAPRLFVMEAITTSLRSLHVSSAQVLRVEGGRYPAPNVQQEGTTPSITMIATRKRNAMLVTILQNHRICALNVKVPRDVDVRILALSVVLGNTQLLTRTVVVLK